MIKLKNILESMLTEDVYDLYHGSDSEFKKFDMSKTYQKIIWFTDTVSDIETDQSGAKGTKYIMQFRVNIKNPAGWEEYKKYGIGQLKDMGFDGVILPQSDTGSNYYIIFKPSQAKYIKTVKGL